MLTEFFLDCLSSELSSLLCEEMLFALWQVVSEVFSEQAARFEDFDRISFGLVSKLLTLASNKEGLVEEQGLRSIMGEGA